MDTLSSKPGKQSGRTRSQLALFSKCHGVKLMSPTALRGSRWSQGASNSIPWFCDPWWTRFHLEIDNKLCSIQNSQGEGIAKSFPNNNIPTPWIVYGGVIESVFLRQGVFKSGFQVFWLISTSITALSNSYLASSRVLLDFWNSSDLQVVYSLSLRCLPLGGMVYCIFKFQHYTQTVNVASAAKGSSMRHYVCLNSKPARNKS